MKNQHGNFYAWEFGPPDDRWVAIPDLNGPFEHDLEISFTFGKPIPFDLEVIEYIVPQRKKYTDFQFNYPGHPLFSKRLRELLAELGVDNIEYYDTRFKTKKGKLIDDTYKIGNVIGTVKCFDWKRSKYDKKTSDEFKVRDIEKVVIRKKQARGHLLFRMEEQNVILLVHSSVRDALLAAGMTGIKFIKPEDYTL